MIHTIRRLPSPRFPADMHTGDPRIDRYLEAIDLRLVGSAAVRRATLLEAREYLLDAREHADAQANDIDKAISEAIDSFGTADDIGREQREDRYRNFRSMALATGPSFAGLMLLLELFNGAAHDKGWAVLAGMFVFHALFFGVFFGYLVTYVMTAARPATAAQSSTDGFKVHYSRPGRWAAWGLLIVFGLFTAAIAAALGNRGPLAGDGFSATALVMMALLAALTWVRAIDGILFKASISDNVLTLRGIGGTSRIAQHQIIGIDKPGNLSQFFWPSFGGQYIIRWHDDAGHTRSHRISLNPDLIGGDRLLAWLESAAASSEGGMDSRLRGNDGM